MVRDIESRKCCCCRLPLAYA